MDDSLQPTEAREATTLDTEFKRGLGLFDSTMIGRCDGWMGRMRSRYFPSLPTITTPFEGR